MTVDGDLRELNVGDLDSRHDAEAWAIHDQVLADWQAGHHDTAFPSGERLPPGSPRRYAA